MSADVAENGASDAEVTSPGTPASAKWRRAPRYHEALLGAFVAGASVEEAARQAGVSRRTTQRWRARYWDQVVTARGEVLDGLLGRVRRALPVALDRLESAAREAKDEAVAVRAALGLWDVFGKASERVEIEQRISALEQALASRGPQGFVFVPERRASTLGNRPQASVADEHPSRMTRSA
jgi:predicted DNA-binding transcriptional regulator YafY